jgi:hypothetical protein
MVEHLEVNGHQGRNSKVRAAGKDTLYSSFALVRDLCVDCASVLGREKALSIMVI